jgi:hypothetical protein
LYCHYHSIMTSTSASSASRPLAATQKTLTSFAFTTGSSLPKRGLPSDDDDDDEAFERPPPRLRAASAPESDEKHQWMTTDDLPVVNHAERFVAMYQTCVALNLLRRLQELYREEVNTRVQRNDPTVQHCYITGLQDGDCRKGV